MNKKPENSLEIPVERAKRLIGLKDSAFKDYVAARLLFLNNQLHQAAIFANTCLEKEIKANLFALDEPFSLKHETFQLFNQLAKKNPEITASINSDFIKVITKVYKSRYHENLSPGYNFVIIKRKFLAELDYTYSTLERKIRYKLLSASGEFPQTKYEAYRDAKSEMVVLENFLLQGNNKEEFLKQKDIVLEFRIAHNHEVLEIMYEIEENTEFSRMIYKGIAPGEDPTRQYITSHKKIKPIYLTRNSQLQKLVKEFSNPNNKETSTIN